MRTTIVLDDKLVADARRALPGKSLRAMVEESLREAIKAKYREELLHYLREGGPPLLADDYDLDENRRLDLEKSLRLEARWHGEE